MSNHTNLQGSYHSLFHQQLLSQHQLLQQQKEHKQHICQLGYETTYQVGKVLERLSETGDQIPQHHQISLNNESGQPFVSPFHSKENPQISILTYFVTVSINAGLQDEQAVAVLILMERLCQSALSQDKPLIICNLTVHRLILTSVLMCSKFYNDIYYSNDQIAQLGGISPEELNLLEVYFMETIDFKLFICEHEFTKYFEGLKSHSLEIQRIQQTQEAALMQALQDQQYHLQVMYQQMAAQQQQQQQQQQTQQQRVLPQQSSRSNFSSQTSNQRSASPMNVIESGSSVSPMSLSPRSNNNGGGAQYQQYQQPQQQQYPYQQPQYLNQSVKQPNHQQQLLYQSQSTRSSHQQFTSQLSPRHHTTQTLLSQSQHSGQYQNGAQQPLFNIVDNYFPGTNPGQNQDQQQ